LDDTRKREIGYRQLCLISVERLYRQWYSNGQLAIEETYKDGKLNGLYRSWYTNGQLSFEKNYKDSKLNDLFRSWYCNGGLWDECIYIDGVEVVPRRAWNNEGVLISDK